MINVLIADQSYVVRRGFTSLLEEFSEVEVVHVVESESDFLGVITRNQPDILLINTSFLSGERRLLLNDEILRDVTVFYVFNTELASGSLPNHLSLLESKSELGEKISEAIKSFKNKSETGESEEISTRERLILKHVALGQTNKEIANELFISMHTVISHRKNITRKLGIKTVSGLTVYAILNNIIHMDDIS